MRTDWIHRTNKGRVVYDRRPHAWTSKDVKRIARGSDLVFWNIPELDWEKFINNYEKFFEKNVEDFEGFGGGVFAGGGATRSWEYAEPEEIVSSIDKGIIVIIRGGGS